MREDVCCIGTTSTEFELGAPVTLSRVDRSRHIFVLGGSGVGKTTLLKTLIYDDLVHGRHFALIDPLGHLADAILDAVPVARTEQVIAFNPGGDLERAIAFNPLDRVPLDRRHLVADGVTSVFMHIWDASLEDTPRLIYILYNSARLLLDNESTTLLGLPRLLVDDDYRARLLVRCTDPVVRGFWQNEFAAYSPQFRTQVIGSVQNKIGMLLSPPALRAVLGQPRSTLDLEQLMNRGGILVCNLAKGYMGETGAMLLGGMIATSIALVAQQRAGIPMEQRRPFTLYADELQNYATTNLASVLAEARNFKLGLVGAHQYFAQLPDQLRHSLISNAATKIVYRVSSVDAEHIAKDLGLDNWQTLCDLPDYQARCKLMRDGAPTDAMLVDMLEAEPPARGRALAVKHQSDAIHTRPRAMVERAILRQLQ